MLRRTTKWIPASFSWERSREMVRDEDTTNQKGMALSGEGEDQKLKPPGLPVLAGAHVRGSPNKGSILVKQPKEPASGTGRSSGRRRKAWGWPGRPR